MIIDVHGHYTTAPKALELWRNQQIAGIQDAALMPKVADLKISDDELRESIETNQLAKMRERGSDLTVFSPRASFMAHHIGDFQVSSTWALPAVALRFVGAAGIVGSGVALASFEGPLAPPPFTASTV